MTDILFHISIISILSIMFYQDMKFRGISWILFLLLFLIVFIRNFFQTDMGELLETGLYNSIYIFLIVLSMKVYFSFARGKLTRVVNRVIGEGDIYFLLAIAVFFSPFNFILFYLLSKLLIILFVRINNLIAEKPMRKVPEAGFQAAILMAIYIFNLWTNTIEFSSDEWVVEYLA